MILYRESHAAACFKMSWPQSSPPGLFNCLDLLDEIPSDGMVKHGQSIESKALEVISRRIERLIKLVIDGNFFGSFLPVKL